MTLETKTPLGRPVFEFFSHSDRATEIRLLVAMLGVDFFAIGEEVFEHVGSGADFKPKDGGIADLRSF